MIPQELCKGCKNYRYSRYGDIYYCFHRLKATYLFNLTLEICPCTNCLMKPMCSQQCEDFLNYKSMYLRNRRY